MNHMYMYKHFHRVPSIDIEFLDCRAIIQNKLIMLQQLTILKSQLLNTQPLRTCSYMFSVQVMLQASCPPAISSECFELIVSLYHHMLTWFLEQS